MIGQTVLSGTGGRLTLAFILAFFGVPSYICHSMPHIPEGDRKEVSFLVSLFLPGIVADRGETGPILVRNQSQL